ncbi:hypothetical protein NXC14_PA00269 (plasmid) [Rhizobium sp. NXC14]|nr:hypothetical protein NXC14_PA00269 [Rhizobium sp. NXC14]
MDLRERFWLNYSLTDPLPDFFGSGFSFSGRFVISVSSPTSVSEPFYRTRENISRQSNLAQNAS